MSVLCFESAVKHYSDAGDLVRAVDGVSLSVQPGEVVVLHGPSGSGKTTLLLLAAALLEPDRGRVRFQGMDLAAMSPRELGEYQLRELGFIYQSFHLMSGVPAVENAAMKLLADGVPLRQARGVAEQWLERVGLAGRLDHPPERLSGGERQRVAIARALAGRPKLILADEPTGSLDSRRGAEILRLLADIACEEGAAVLLATHDPQAAAVASRVYALHDGRLAGAAPTVTSPARDAGADIVARGG